MIRDFHLQFITAVIHSSEDLTGNRFV